MNPVSLRPQSLVVGLVFSCLLSLPCCIPHTLVAQSDTLEHTLLWRIDGNGLEHSSYLYGTFHTQDPLAFNFRDSVLPALLSCEIAAFELQIDTMFAIVYQKLYYPDSVTNLRDYLTDEEFALLDERLTEEIGVSAELLQHADPSLLHLLLDEIRVPVTDTSKPDREDLRGLFRFPKETFLDAWLFRTARLEGKTVVGLETFEEQIAVRDTIPVGQRVRMLLESTEYDPAEYRALWRKLVNAYEQEDINILYALVAESDIPVGVKYKLLDERNYRMADRMIALARKAPTFTAVGAAHLGGEYGVIKLLRGKGFTVTPVISERTGVAKAYKRPGTELPWYQMTSENSGFVIETPVPALEFPAEARGYFFEGNLEYWYSTDITTGLTYMVLVRDIPFSTVLSKDVEESIKERWFGNSDPESSSRLGPQSGMLMREKEVTVDSINGKELTGIDTDGDLSRMRIFYHAGKLYLFMVTGGASLIRSKDDSRFLKSISFNRSALKSDWQPRTFTTPYGNDLSITVPGTMRFDTTTDWIRSGTFATTVTGTTVDPVTETYYVVEQTNLPPTTITRLDSILLQWPISYSLPESAETVEKKDLNNPAWGRIAQASSHRLESGMIIRRYTYLQDGTIWSFIAAIPAEGEGANDTQKFFDDIRVKESAISPRQIVNDEQNFRITFTGTPLIDSNIYYQFQTWAAGTWRDEHAFSIDCRTYKPWFEAADEEEFFRDVRSESVYDTDSILDEKIIPANGLQWREYTWKAGETDRSDMQIRERIALHGNRLYRLRLISPDRETMGKAGEEFFDSFSLINPAPEGDLFSRKVEYLLRDIASEDSTTRAQAGNGLWHYELFREEDLPGIYRALERNYPDDTDSSSNTWDRLLNAIATIRNSESVEFLRTFNAGLPKNHSARQEVMETLAAIRSQESVAYLKELLAGDLSHISYPLWIFYPLHDSIHLTRPLFPDILRLASNPEWRYSVLSLTKDALDSGVISNTSLEGYEKELRGVATRTLEIYRKPDYLTEDEETIYAWEATYAIDILGRLPTERETNRLLTRTLRDEEMMVKRAAATALIRQDQNVRSKRLEEIAGDRIERINFYRDLKAMGKLDEYPAEYQSQILLAESLVLEQISYEEEYPPEKIAYVADRQVEWNGESVRGYLFKFRYTTYEEDETGIEDTTATWQYAFCAQPTDIDQIWTEKTRVRVSWETFDPEKLDEHYVELTAMKPVE